jgi:hypothetical protein
MVDDEAVVEVGVVVGDAAVVVVEDEPVVFVLEDEAAADTDDFWKPTPTTGLPRITFTRHEAIRASRKGEVVPAITLIPILHPSKVVGDAKRLTHLPSHPVRRGGCGGGRASGLIDVAALVHPCGRRCDGSLSVEGEQITVPVILGGVAWWGDRKAAFRCVFEKWRSD